MIDFSKVPAAAQGLARSTVVFSDTEEVRHSSTGGFPPDIPGFEWPTNNGVALSLIANIDLSELKSTEGWIPREGHLLFFYDFEEEPSGYDPEDIGGWRVLFLPQYSSEAGPLSAPKSLNPGHVIKPRFLSFTESPSFPSGEHPKVLELGLSEEEGELYFDALFDDEGGEGDHGQVGGFPQSASGTCQALESDLVSNGVDLGDGYPEEVEVNLAERLDTAEGKWGLLFYYAMEEREEEEASEIYSAREFSFWVPIAEAQEGSFENVWLHVEES